MRKFKCPRCGGVNITQVAVRGVRKSKVLKIDGLSDDQFLCTSPEFSNFNHKGNIHYECPECNLHLGRSPDKIVEDFFVEEFNSFSKYLAELILERFKS